MTIAKAILRVPLLDYNCGFKLYRSEAAKKIFEKQLMSDWSFDAELMLLARKFNFRISEIAVNWRHGENSKVRPIKDSIKTFAALLKIKRNDLAGKYRINPRLNLQTKS